MAALVFSSLGSQLALASKSLFRSLLILLAFLASQILDVMVMGYFAKGLFFSLALVVLSVVGRGTSSPVSSLVIGAILTGAYGFGAAALLAIIVFCAALLTETVVWSLKLQADRRARRTVRQLFGRSRSALFVMLGTFLSAGFLMNLQGLDARAGSGPFTRNQLLTNFLDLTWWGRVEEINSIHAGSVSLILTACVLGLFVSLTRGEPTVAFQLTFLLGFSGLVFFSPLGTWVSYHFVSLGALVVLLALATTRLRTGLFALGLAALVIAGFSAARLSNGSPSAEIRTAEANEDRRVSAPKVDLSDCSKPLIEIGSSVSTPVALYLQNVIEDLEPERSVVSREVYQSERAWKEWPARFGPSSSTQGLEWSGGSFRCQAR